MKTKVIFELNGTELKMSENWPVTKPTNTILTEAQLAFVETAIDEQAKKLRWHIKNDGWDVTADIYVGDVLQEIFGCHFDDYVTARIAAKTKEVYTKYGNGGATFVNTVEKVFYSPVRNKLYTGLVKKDVDNDIIVGEL